MNILLNHLGYTPAGYKKAIIKYSRKPERTCSQFTIIEEKSGNSVYSGDISPLCAVENWKEWHFQEIDFTPLAKPGSYKIVVLRGNNPIESYPFLIEENILEYRTYSNVLCYFKSQRCSGIYEKADYSRHFADDRQDRVDVHGGWYDASGDFSKLMTHLSFSNYFNPQQAPIGVWALLKTYDNIAARNETVWTHHLRRTIEEGIYGADFLKRMQDKDGYFYELLTDKLTKDPEKRVICSSSHFLGPATSDYKSGYRQGAGIAIAALAKASTYNYSGDYAPEEYLETAETGFAHLERYNTEYLNDNKENIIDDYCALLAAAELYKASKKDIYLTAGRKRAQSLMDRLSNDDTHKGWWRADEDKRPFFHPAEAGFPVISLLHYYECESDKKIKSRVLETVKQSLKFELEITGNVVNPFGYARQLTINKEKQIHEAFFFPHDAETAPWWQGENARLGSLAAAARLAVPYFRNDQDFTNALEQYAGDQINWILGLNPFDICMLHGSGRNNPEYRLDYPNAPGGICNGITGGFTEKTGIDFLAPESEGKGDHNWRWTEQWIPHPSWYILAVTS